MATKYDELFADLAAIVSTGDYDALTNYIGEAKDGEDLGTNRSFNPNLLPLIRGKDFAHRFFDPTRIFLGKKLVEIRTSAMPQFLENVFEAIFNEILWLGKNQEVQGSIVYGALIPPREGGGKLVNHRLQDAVQRH